ncbi:hypothetical protein, partial [Pseudomonas aeruginosa]
RTDECERIIGALISKLDALLQAVQYKTGIWADNESFAAVIKEVSPMRQAMADARGEVQNLASALWEVKEERDAALARCAELEAKLSDPTAVHQWQFSNAWFDCSKEALLKAGKEGSPIRTLYTAP